MFRQMTALNRCGSTAATILTLFVDYFCYQHEHEGKVMETPAKEEKDYDSEMSEFKFHLHAKDEECYLCNPGIDFSPRPSETNIEDIENFSE